MTKDFDPKDYPNVYRRGLQEVIDAKEGGREVVHTETPAADTGAKITDLLAALKESVDRAKATRDEEKPAPKKRAKKAA